MMKSRIGLLATEMTTPGGVQAYMLRIAEALSPDGSAEPWEFHCVSLNDDTESLRRHPSLGRCASVSGASRSKWRFVLDLLALPRLDTLIVGHLGPSPLGWFLRAIGRAERYVVVLHGIEAWQRLPWPKRWAARGADAVVATTVYTAREFARLNGIREDRLRVIPLCADERTRANNTDFKLNGAFKLLCVARQAASERYKGFEMIFEALARIPDEPTPHLNLVGAGDDQPRLRAVAAQLGVQDRVTFWGILDDARLAAAYEDCDVFVMPSKQEGFGIVFLEAMLRGKPCIGGRARRHARGRPRTAETGFLVDLRRRGRPRALSPRPPRRPGAAAAGWASEGRHLAAHAQFSAAAFRERWRRLVLEELGGARLSALEPTPVGKKEGKVS
ncbi:MAG: hypothetical protein KatS3mg082_3344 [Nitrospiraceae bacterium]|nr:MAG: hypothetical protein KatS3mg082_3344 [Nitrospiraceae bacterium]